MTKKISGKAFLLLFALAATVFASCGNRLARNQPAGISPSVIPQVELPQAELSQEGTPEQNSVSAVFTEPSPLSVLPDAEQSVAILLEAAGKSDFGNLDSLALDAERTGLLDALVAAIEARAALPDSPPAVHIALSVLYGRKGLRTKEYAALAAAEAAARQPNVIFNIALVHGRKKLLEGSPDADSFMVGNLSVETDPPGAALSLDGKPAGTTPVKLGGLKAGAHTLAFAMSGYEPVSLGTEIAVGSDTLFSKTLVSMNATGGSNPIMNQILNDSFEYDLQKENGQWWELYCDEANGNFGIARMDSREAVKGRQSLGITVSKLNGVLHEPHLKIIGLNVEKGKKYTYSVFMKADRACRIVFDIRRFRIETFYGNSPELWLGTEWKEYSFTVTAPESNSGDVMVLTHLGRDVANIWVDNARFYAADQYPDAVN